MCNYITENLYGYKRCIIVIVASHSLIEIGNKKPRVKVFYIWLQKEFVVFITSSMLGFQLALVILHYRNRNMLLRLQMKCQN